MQFITGDNRHQTFFSKLEKQISNDHPVKLIDAFIDKLDLAKMVLLKQYRRAKAVHHMVLQCW